MEINSYIWAMVLGLLFFLFMSLTSCAQPNTDYDFSEYIQLYKQRAHDVGKEISIPEDLKIVMGHIESSSNKKIFATCKGAVIVVDEDGWSYHLTDVEKEIVIVHELTHIVLKREHLNTLTSENIPISLMHFSMVSEDIYLQNYWDYMEELFWGPF